MPLGEDNGMTSHLRTVLNAEPATPIVKDNVVPYKLAGFFPCKLYANITVCTRRRSAAVCSGMLLVCCRFILHGFCLPRLIYRR